MTIIHMCFVCQHKIIRLQPLHNGTIYRICGCGSQPELKVVGRKAVAA